MLGALTLQFTSGSASPAAGGVIGIIGGADDGDLPVGQAGPELLAGAIAVAAVYYSAGAVNQPPIMKAAFTTEERNPHGAAAYRQ